MFEKATRLKLRFVSTRGNISVEDLWDLSLEDLDLIAKNLRNQLKEDQEESFIKRTRQSPKKALAFEIVKHVINVKLDEAENAKTAADKKAKRQELMAIIAEKQSEETRGKSIEELTKELEALDA